MEENNQQQRVSSIANFLVENDLFLIPLQSIKNSRCTCGYSRCQSPGKHPLLRYSWKKVATSDKIAIQTWLTKPNVNYGVATGRKSGTSGKYLVVIDIDAPEHDLLAYLPPTFNYRTGSGGWHFWFWSNLPVSNSARKLYPQVDVRGTGGYVVIPPSKHISGLNYELGPSLLDQPILHLPEFLDILLGKDPAKPRNKCKRVNNSNLNSVLFSETDKISAENEWSRMSVSEIKNRLSSGDQIPVGLRNVVIHRLLSSDRALGAERDVLWTQAQKYRQFCQDASQISDKELRASCTQVLKYGAYSSTSYDQVNDNFFMYMDRGRKAFRLTEEEKTEMKSLDDQFFIEMLTKSSGDKKSRTSWLTLSQVSVLREEVMAERFPKYSRYPLPLLAAKLKATGFERRRTAKQNVWNVLFSREKMGLTNEGIRGILNMASNNTFSGELSTMTSSVVPATVPSAAPPAIPNLPPGTKVETKEITVKRRKHPSEPRYCGRENQELGSALTKLITLLEPAQRDGLLSRTLVLDEEGTIADFDTILKDDRVGIALEYEEGWISTMVNVEKVENDTIYGKDHYTKDDCEFSFEEASVARAMGYFEILYRPDAEGKPVPYGIDTEMKVQVHYTVEDKDTTPALTPEEEAANAASGATTHPEAAKTLMDIKKREIDAAKKVKKQTKEAALAKKKA